MKKTREEKDKAFHKIVKCVRSCETSIHTVNCDHMIDNFEKLFKKDFPDVRYESNILYEECLMKNAVIMGRN